MSKKKKEWEWSSIRVNSITVASGWKCPECGLLRSNKSCYCSLKKLSKNSQK